MTNEKIYTKPGPVHKRQPTVFSPQRALGTERLNELERAAWNSEVNILKQKKKVAKDERKAAKAKS